MSTDTPFDEKKVYARTPEKVYAHTPTKERKQHAAAGDSRNEYVIAFEHFTGRMVASEYESDRIKDWERRVTLDGWKSALEKTAQTRPNNFWRYIETILRDYEQNGFRAQEQTESTLSFSMEDLI